MGVALLPFRLSFSESMDVSKVRANSTCSVGSETDVSTFLRNRHKFLPNYTVSSQGISVSTEEFTDIRVTAAWAVLGDCKHNGAESPAVLKGMRGAGCGFVGSPSCSQGSCAWRKSRKISPVRKSERISDGAVIGNFGH
jgi:hypothetical protein